jgi:hypothetical protein
MMKAVADNYQGYQKYQKFFIDAVVDVCLFFYEFSDYCVEHKIWF